MYSSILRGSGLLPNEPEDDDPSSEDSEDTGSKANSEAQILLRQRSGRFLKLTFPATSRLIHSAKGRDNRMKELKNKKRETT